MDEAYRSFFSTSAGASAAFIGLLFVALSFITAENVDPPTRELRRIIANNAFLQLVNIFFVSMVSLYADVGGLAQASLVMGLGGLISSTRMLPKSFKIDKSAPRLPWVISGIPIVAYIMQVAVGALLVGHLNNTGLVHYLALAVVFLYAGALARAWEITGLRNKG